MTFGEKVRQLRKNQKLTQGELAERIGTHESHIGRYEKNQSSPTAPVLKKIAQLFNVSTDYLLFDDQTESITKPDISDVELYEQFKQVEKMNDEKKDLVKRILSMAINEENIKKMLS